MGIWRLQLIHLLQRTQLCWGAGCHSAASSSLLKALGLQLHVFQEIQATFPSSSHRPKGPSGERQHIFKEKGGKGGRCGRVTKKNTKKILWLGQECAWVNRSQASCHIHSCAGQGGVQGAGGAGSLSGQDTSCQPAPGRQTSSLPPAWGG